MVLYRMHRDVCGRANLAKLESRRIRFSPRVEFASEWIHPRTCVPALTPRGPLLIARKASPCSLCTQTAHASHAACRTYRPTVLGTGYGFESTGQKRCDDDWPSLGSHQSAQRSTRAALCSARCIRPNQAARDRRIVRHGIVFGDGQMPALAALIALFAHPCLPYLVSPPRGRLARLAARRASNVRRDNPPDSGGWSY